MDIQTRKIEFIKEFLKLESEEVISQFENLLGKKRIKEIEQNLKPMTKAELNKRIDKSEEDFKNNRYKSTAELIAKY